MKKLLFIIIIATITISGCMDCIDGKGELVSKVMKPESFNKIELKVPAHVILTRGDTPSLKINAQQNILDEISTEVAGSTLTIELERNCINNSKGITIYITASELEKLIIDGSAEVESQGTFASPEIKMEINGSGSIELSLQTDLLKASVSGSGKYLLHGTAKEQEYSINGSGEVYAFEMPGSICGVEINGSGNCRVMSLEKLDVSISGSGSVFYKGSPDLSTDINGSGKVKKED